MAGLSLMLSIAATITATSSQGSAKQSILVDEITAARLLMQSGHHTPAEELLRRKLATEPRNLDALFLSGMIAIAQENYRFAVSRFREALIYDPRAMRIRLELARAFYLKHDYENAFRQFQLARAGNPPAGVIASIDKFLLAIRQEKSWSYNFDVAVAPDTNINNGPSARETTLFGLPFDLSDETRRRSGIGLAVDAGAEIAPRIGRRMRMRMGAAIQRRDYKGSDVDDMTLALQAGPRLIAEKWDLSLLGTAYRRSYGGRRYNQGNGLRAEAIYYPSRAEIALGFSVQQVTYPDLPRHDGPVVSASAAITRALSPSSSLRAQAAIARQAARGPENANWSGQVAVGYYRDLKGSFSAYIEPSFALVRYDAADPLFGERREDRIQGLTVALLNRRIVWSRFTPRLSYTFSRRRSTISLYEFDQSRFELGLTSIF